MKKELTPAQIKLIADLKDLFESPKPVKEVKPKK